MKTICAWCKAELFANSVYQSDGTEISHGICQECRIKVEQQLARERQQECAHTISSGKNNLTFFHLKAIVELAPDSIIVTDKCGKIIFANSQTYNTFGFLPDDILGEKIEILIPEKFKDSHISQRDSFVESNSTRPMGQNLNILGRHANGSEIPLDIKLSPLRIGENSYIVAVTRDISHIKKIQNELNESLNSMKKLNKKLESINAEKNILLGTAAHDLRNPLHNLLIATDLMMNKAQDMGIEPQWKILKQMRESISYMNQLVESLLDFASIESGKLNLCFSPINVQDKIEECLRFNHESAKKKQIKIITTPLPEDINLILVDPQKLLQALDNLVVNAIKFSPKESKIHINVHNKMDGIEIQVIDQGPGIPIEKQEEVFNPFSSTSNNSESIKSVGLGLAIAKRIIESHNGKLSLESRPGFGSTFKIWLPMHTNPQSVHFQHHTDRNFFSSNINCADNINSTQHAIASKATQ